MIPALYLDAWDYIDSLSPHVLGQDSCFEVYEERVFVDSHQSVLPVSSVHPLQFSINTVKIMKNNFSYIVLLTKVIQVIKIIPNLDFSVIFSPLGLS